MEENSFQAHCVLSFLSRFVETSANMADSRPARGRPRRPEGIKRLKLRESTYNLWIERKEALGLHGITNNDFAEMLLHQQLIRERDRSPHAHPDDTSPQVHQGKILNNFSKKTLFFYYAIIAVLVFRYFFFYTFRILSYFLAGRRQLFLQSTPMGKEIRTENITVSPLSFAGAAENSSLSK